MLVAARLTDIANRKEVSRCDLDPKHFAGAGAEERD